MRTVLAVDEMLAHVVAPRLPGEVEVLGHMAMRDLGPLAVARLREMVMERPSVLAIGAKAWDALPMLRQIRLPYRVPVVLLVPEVTWEGTRQAAELDVFSIVPAKPTRKIVSTVAAECVLAWKWLESRRRRRRSTILIAPSLHRPVEQPGARLLLFRRDAS